MNRVETARHTVPLRAGQKKPWEFHSTDKHFKEPGEPGLSPLLSGRIPFLDKKYFGRERRADVIESLRLWRLILQEAYIMLEWRSEWGSFCLRKHS